MSNRAFTLIRGLSVVFTYLVGGGLEVEVSLIGIGNLTVNSI